MRIIYLISSLFFFSENNLLSKTVDAYPLSSIVLDDKIKFSSVSGVYFFGKVCRLKSEINALNEITEIYFEICDVEYASIKAFYNYPYFRPGNYMEIASKMKSNDIICFKIEEVAQILMYSETNSSLVLKGSMEYQNDCNFVPTIQIAEYRKNDFFKNIDNKHLNKSYVGQIVRVSGVMKYLNIGKKSFAITIENSFHSYLISINLSKIVGENKKKLINKIKKIRNMNHPRLKSTGYVKSHQYGYALSGVTQLELESNDFVILSN